MNNKIKLLISILIALGIGFISALFTKDSMELYTNLELPPLSPPSSAFPIVWNILYILMGLSSYMIYMSRNSLRTPALGAYFLQLVFNSIWTFVFFNSQKYFLGILVLIILIILVLIMISCFYQIDKKSGYLQLPYALWLLFALYLNIGIWILNV